MMNRRLLSTFLVLGALSSGAAAYADTIAAAPNTSVAATSALATAAPPGRSAATRLGAGGTLEAVREAGTLNCGVISDLDDYSEADTHGDLSAFGAEFCRAIGAELFDDPARTTIRGLPDEPSGLAALRDGKVDVLFGVTPNPVIGATYHTAFGPPIFFDGQGFLVPRDGGITTLADLSRRHVCFINAAPPEQTLYDALEPRLAVREERFPYSERGEMEAALVGGHCDAITGDISWMANVRASLHGQVSRFMVLPEMISLDPMSPAYRTGDAPWALLLDWTVWALLQAEEHGVTRANAASLTGSPDPVVRRLTGAMPWIGRALGVADDAFLHAIETVGNYGEIYDRDVGSHSRLALPRGRNALASQGGLMWTLPVEPLQ
ncbi:MAG: hypothetical protein ACRYHQ_25175 [Janthinobacterium lividum]